MVPRTNEPVKQVECAARYGKLWTLFISTVVLALGAFATVGGLSIKTSATVEAQAKEGKRFYDLIDQTLREIDKRQNEMTKTLSRIEGSVDRLEKDGH